MNVPSDSGSGPLSLSAGRVLDSVTLSNARIQSQDAFTNMLTNDCFYHDLKITTNLLLMQDWNSLGIHGVLSSGEFRDNHLSLVGDKPFSIKLYPGRIGCNTAEDGVLNILSFKVGSEWQYGSFAAVNNRLHVTNEPVAVRIEDERHVVPLQLSYCSAGLVNFDYETFYRQYLGWTVRDFQSRDSAGYARLYDWLERREEEYRSGVRADKSLPPPTPEQQSLVENALIDSLTQARAVMSRNHADFRGLRLAELPYTPLRSFIMKRLALRNAELLPLLDIGKRNAYRQACLQFLLPAWAFSQLQSDAGMVGVTSIPGRVETIQVKESVA